MDSDDKAIQFAAIRQTLDEDLRRFVREGIITMPSDPDADNVIVGVKSFIRRQRNPLLDTIAFFEHRQQKGGSFDSYYAHLNGLFKASDFTSSLCSPCSARICKDGKDTVRQRHADMLRDRILYGIWEDDVRHKLLAKPKLTLEDAIQLCGAEEGATQTKVGIPVVSTILHPARHNFTRDK